MRHLSLLLLLFLSFQINAQQELHSRVFIQLDDKYGIEDLAELGLEIDHGEYAPQKHFINDFSESEIQQIEAAGFTYEILIADVGTYYVEQMAVGDLYNRNLSCGEGNENPYQYDTPANWEPGSMAGYFTYQEMLDELDEMAAAYPDLITSRTEIGDIVTHDGYPIYWLRLSDNPDQNESEPEVLYTALHHAREPGSLSQMIFYLWYMLEQYGTNPEVTYLIDNTEMYFIPCINPDGYLYNEFTNPDGGGFWRKNRRDNLDGTFGVDLNRNYGFEWGFDDTGSSPNTNSQTYRGPGPFSEPETAAVEYFCNEHEFQIALNYHCYGNLLIYPWGYLDSPTDESAIFTGFANAMTRENYFFAGTGTETVGYTVNGTSDDWMYGEQTTKPPIFSMTPEVGPGTFGFWPPIEYLDILIKSTVLMNLTTAHLVLNYGVVTDDSPISFSEASGNEIDYTLTRYGLMDGPLTVSLTPLSDNILSVLDGPQSYSLNLNDSASDAFGFEVKPTTPSGDDLVFLLSVDNGSVILSDTLRKAYLSGEEETIFMSDGEDLPTWTANDSWGLSDQIFYSAPYSVTDSPNGNYTNNTINTLVSPEIDLTGLNSANLNFWGLWEIEPNYDYVLVSAVDVITGDATPLCGNYTNPGTGNFQPTDVPLYDGFQSDWVQEIICLDDFVGTSIYIEFDLISDGGLSNDGFYFDDMEVTTFIPDTVTTSTVNLTPQQGLRLFPNPAEGYVWVDIPAGDFDQDKTVMIYDALGRQVATENFQGKRQRVEIKTLSAGYYFVEVLQDGQRLGSSSLLVNK